MNGLFVFLLLVILGLLAWSMIAPNKLAKRLDKSSQKNLSRKHFGIVFGGLAVVFFVLVGITAPKTKTVATVQTDANTSQPTKQVTKTVTAAHKTTTTTPKATATTTPVTTTAKPSTPVLTGFGATQDEWNKTHTMDTRATANSSYDPGEGTSDCSNFGDRYYGMTGTTDYSMCFPSGQSLATSQGEVMQEFPSDTTILWQGKQTSGEPDECYQMEVHSATLASVLGGDGDAFVEFQTLDPNNTSGNIEYVSSNVNDAMLIGEDNASLSTASGC